MPRSGRIRRDWDLGSQREIDQRESSDAADGPLPGQMLIYRDGALQLQVRLDGQTVWLTQRGLAELYQVSVPSVNEHLRHIYDEGELQPEATIRKFRIVQIEARVKCLDKSSTTVSRRYCL